MCHWWQWQITFLLEHPEAISVMAFCMPSIIFPLIQNLTAFLFSFLWLLIVLLQRNVCPVKLYLMESNRKVKPTVTNYAIKPQKATKGHKMTNLADIRRNRRCSAVPLSSHLSILCGSLFFHLKEPECLSDNAPTHRELNPSSPAFPSLTCKCLWCLHWKSGGTVCVFCMCTSVPLLSW